VMEEIEGRNIILTKKDSMTLEELAGGISN
jgi:hypothetical protein